MKVQRWSGQHEQSLCAVFCTADCLYDIIVMENMTQSVFKVATMGQTLQMMWLKTQISKQT